VTLQQVPQEQAIRLTMPARVELLRLARMTAATVCAELGFSLQDIEDVRVAVDELAALLIEDVIDGASLDLRFDPDPDTLTVVGEVADGTGPLPEIHAVAAELLSLVVDSYELSLEDGVRRFRLVKHRGRIPA